MLGSRGIAGVQTMADTAMNGYGLTAVVVQSIAALAWPAAIFAIFWIFRKKLVELLPFFTVKHVDWEASFRLDKAEEEAASLAPIEAAPESLPTVEESDRFEQIAKLSPSAALAEVRFGVESAVNKLAKSKNLYPIQTGDRTLLENIRLLRKAGAIDSATSSLLDDLRAIGNAAVHGKNFTFDEAIRYKKLADETLWRLSKLQ